MHQALSGETSRGAYAHSCFIGGPLNGRQIYPLLQHVKQAKCSSSSPLVTRDNFEIIGRDNNNYLLPVKKKPGHLQIQALTQWEQNERASLSF